MKFLREAQFFALLAIAVGLAVSYVPPSENGAAIWMMVGAFLTRAMDGLFQKKVSEAPPEGDAPKSGGPPTMGSSTPGSST